MIDIMSHVRIFCSISEKVHTWGMGLVTSGASPRDQNDVPRGIYPKYGWVNEQFAANIQRGVVTPCFAPSDRPGQRDLSYCELCYHGFPRINESKCCRHAACTECLAAYISPANFNTRICPFCRKVAFEIRANVTRSELKKPFDGGNVADEPVIADWDEALPEEVNLIFIQFHPNEVQKQMIIELYNAGIPTNEIIEQLGP